MYADGYTILNNTSYAFPYPQHSLVELTTLQLWCRGADDEIGAAGFEHGFDVILDRGSSEERLGARRDVDRKCGRSANALDSHVARDSGLVDVRGLERCHA